MPVPAVYGNTELDGRVGVVEEMGSYRDRDVSSDEVGVGDNIPEHIFYLQISNIRNTEREIYSVQRQAKEAVEKDSCLNSREDCQPSDRQAPPSPQ